MSRRFLLPVLFAVVLASPDSTAVTIDLRRVASVPSPILVTHAGDARIFIVEQTGIIRVLTPGAVAPATFLDIRTRILSGGERGLLGLAFHPSYATNGRFFVFYTRTGDGALTIAEYGVSANPNVADSAERVILTIPHPTFANHNGGMLAFGRDGYLYIGTGDGGSGNDPSNNAQNLESLLGKILRIDIDANRVTYAIPSTNPFVNIAGRDEIYLYGLRNPWRFSFDRASGNLVIGDVGQGAIEEINWVTSQQAGGNFGWRVYEGTRCTNVDPEKCTGSGYIFPQIEYDHSGGRCSVTGGYHYNGTRRALATSTYLFADYCSGTIYATTSPSTGAFSVELDTTYLISTFGEDFAGELYATDQRGTVYRIVNKARNDFGGDADVTNLRNDLVWRHSRTGRNVAWLMTTDGQTTGTAEMQTVADANWEIRGAADFDGDGHVDLLWRNRATGNNAVWFMDGTRFRESRSLQSVTDPSWIIAATNDMNGDGWPDIIWRNVASGYNAVWLMYGTTFVDSRALPASPDLAWQIAGVDDMNDDGSNDIIWHRAEGANAVWLMSGTTFSTSTTLDSAAGPWNLEGVGDMNGDAKPDLIWRNTSSGENAVWIMNNLALAGVMYLPRAEDPDFHIAAPR